MKVGSRADYGLRALAYLAERASSGECVQIHTIAKRQAIPEDYLRQLLVHLRTAGMVRSVRGPHGGYLLADDAKNITLARVIEVLEGPPDWMHCRHHEDDDPPCSVYGACSVRATWDKSLRAMQAVLEQTTLADILKESRALGAEA